MNLDNKIKFFCDLENNLNVTSWKVNDVEIWPYLRFEINRILIFKTEFHNKSVFMIKLAYFRKIVKEIFGLFKYFYYYLADYKHNSKLNNDINVVILTQSTRRDLLMNEYYDRICDPFVDILKELSYQCYSLEWTYDHKYRIPRHNDSVFIQHHIDFIVFKSIFTRKHRYRLGDQLENFNSFLSVLDSQNINKEKFIKKVENDLCIIFNLKDYFKNILKKINPVVCFHFPYFGIVGSAFNIACRELNLISVDIQHGYYGSPNVLYTDFLKIPEDGYKMLPEYFWGWDILDRRNIENWNKSVTQWHKPYTGGNLWINLWKNNQLEVIKIYDNKLIQLKSKWRKAIHILVTLSPNLLIPEWLTEAIEQSPEKWFWGIRLHQNTTNTDRRAIYRIFENYEAVEIKDIKDFSLNAILRHMDIHVTIDSSCIIEAKSFNVPSIIISEDGASIFKEEILSGWAKTAYSSIDLIKNIKYQLSVRSKLIEQKEEQSFSNHENIIKFLNEIGCTVKNNN